jgi:hypothetical protein
MNVLDAELLQILACPQCHAPLAALPDGAARHAVTALRCTEPACGLRFPIIDGVPALLVQAAEPSNTATSTS